MTAIRPLGGRVIIEPLTRELQTTRIVLPQAHGKDDYHFGKVVAIGQRRIKNGTLIPCLDGIETGDTVYYSRAGGWDRTVDGKELVCVHPNYIHAKLSKDANVEHFDSQGIK